MTESILLLHPGEMGASVGARRCAPMATPFGGCTRGRSDATRQRAAAADLIRRSRTFEEALGKRGERDFRVSARCRRGRCAERARRGIQRGLRRCKRCFARDREASGRHRGRRLRGRRDHRAAGDSPRAQRACTCPANSPQRSHPGLRVPWWMRAWSECSASALKMCYAAFTKGSSALILAIRALAASHGAENALLSEWDISQSGLAARSDAAARGTSRKAWRFEGEMREIAATFADAGLPAGFHRAASDIYRRMRDLKDRARRRHRARHRNIVGVASTD